HLRSGLLCCAQRSSQRHWARLVEICFGLRSFAPVLSCPTTQPPSSQPRSLAELWYSRSMQNRPTTTARPTSPSYSFIRLFLITRHCLSSIRRITRRSWVTSLNPGTFRLTEETYTFKLCRNVLFHDGSPLTFVDVKASYERIIHPPEGVLSVRQ